MLARNLDALAARGVVLPEATPQDFEVRLSAGPADAVLSVCTGDGRWVRMHSQRDPITEADHLIAPAFESIEPALIVVIGLGLGYVLDALERRSSRTKVLALEPVPASLRPMLARRDWSAWLNQGRLRLLVAPDYSGASDAWQDFDADASTPPIIVHPVLAHHITDGVVRARTVVDRIVFGARSNLNARQRNAGRYLINTLKNLPVIAREGNAGTLFDAFKGIPAIVASAGPSLDRNMPWLREFQDRAILIAADTALRPLLGAGIEPHLAVGLDPSEANGRHLTNLPEPSRTWLVAEGSMDPVVFEQFEGRTFIFKVSNHHPWPWLGGLGIERDTLRAWGSVATSAFDLALKMGCDPIIFAGQDLAYTDGRPYCRGTTNEDAWAAQVADGNELPDVWARMLGQPEARTVDDISGNGVVTMPQLVAFRDWFVEQISRLDRRTVINATGGGILHGPGILQSALRSVRASLSPVRELHARVSSSWRRTSGDASIEPKRTALKLLDAFERVSGGPELTEWATFANVTTNALSVELEEVAAVVHGQLAHARTDRHAGVVLASSPVRSYRGACLHAPERNRAYLALLLDEPVPEWARAAAANIDPLDAPAFWRAIEGVRSATLCSAAERCENEGAFSHAAALFSRLADRRTRDQDPEALPARHASLRCLFWAGSFEAALAVIDGEPPLSDHFAAGWRASIYQLTGNQQQAIATIDGLVVAFPELPGLRLNLAVRLALIGNLREALQLVDVDAARWPGRVLPAYTQGVCLRLCGQHKAAIKVLEGIVDEWPYAAPELVVASVAAEQWESFERAARTLHEPIRNPAVFVTVPDGQADRINAAMAQLGAELATQDHHVEVSRPSPICVRVFNRSLNRWQPTWRP
jgi:hypothetical protein